MNNYTCKGYITKDYEIQIKPHNGIYPIEDMEYYLMKEITGDDLPDDAEEFFLNYVCIRDSELYANATIKHYFEEDSQGVDEDDAEENLLLKGNCTWRINKDHNGKYLIEIDEIERI